MEERVSGVLKHRPEDFIVEEIGNEWNCSVEGKGTSLDELKESKDFLWCEMVKKEIDHFQAMIDIARKLGQDLRDIGYAGTKDKVAWTSQRISIFKPDLGRVKNFSHPKIVLKNFKWVKRKIKLGYLEGNSFRIVVRGVDKKDAIKISNRISGTKSFPNYFGAQRFGSVHGNNAKIGKLILKRKFKEAVGEILKDFPDMKRFEKEEDAINFLKKSKRKNVLLFVHAVQSKIFNEILERALEEGLDFTKKGHQNCILPGYKTRFYDGRLGEIERDVLNDNELKLEDFDITEIPHLRIKGSFRKAVIEIEKVNISIEEDEDFSSSKKIVLSFNLPSGVYATTFLEGFFDFSVPQ